MSMNLGYIRSNQVDAEVPFAPGVTWDADGLVVSEGDEAWFHFAASHLPSSQEASFAVYDPTQDPTSDSFTAITDDDGATLPTLADGHDQDGADGEVDSQACADGAGGDAEAIGDADKQASTGAADVDDVESALMEMNPALKVAAALTAQHGRVAATTDDRALIQAAPVDPTDAAPARASRDTVDADADADADTDTHGDTSDADDASVDSFAAALKLASKPHTPALDQASIGSADQRMLEAANAATAGAIRMQSWEPRQGHLLSGHPDINVVKWVPRSEWAFSSVRLESLTDPHASVLGSVKGGTRGPAVDIAARSGAGAFSLDDAGSTLSQGTHGANHPQGLWMKDDEPVIESAESILGRLKKPGETSAAQLTVPVLAHEPLVMTGMELDKLLLVRGGGGGDHSDNAGRDNSGQLERHGSKKDRRAGSGPTGDGNSGGLVAWAAPAAMGSASIGVVERVHPDIPDIDGFGCQGSIDVRIGTDRRLLRRVDPEFDVRPLLGVYKARRWDQEKSEHKRFVVGDVVEVVRHYSEAGLTRSSLDLERLRGLHRPDPTRFQQSLAALQTESFEELTHQFNESYTVEKFFSSLNSPPGSEWDGNSRASSRVTSPSKSSRGHIRPAHLQNLGLDERGEGEEDSDDDSGELGFERIQLSADDLEAMLGEEGPGKREEGRDGEGGKEVPPSPREDVDVFKTLQQKFDNLATHIGGDAAKLAAAQSERAQAEALVKSQRELALRNERMRVRVEELLLKGDEVARQADLIRSENGVGNDEDEIEEEEEDAFFGADLPAQGVPPTGLLQDSVTSTIGGHTLATQESTTTDDSGSGIHYTRPEAEADFQVSSASHHAEEEPPEEVLTVRMAIAAQRKLYSEAAEIYRQAIVTSPFPDGRLYARMARCRIKCHQWEAALDQAEKAIKCLADNPRCYFYKGLALLEMQRFHESKETLKYCLGLASSRSGRGMDTRMIRHYLRTALGRAPDPDHEFITTDVKVYGETDEQKQMDLDMTEYNVYSYVKTQLSPKHTKKTGWNVLDVIAHKVRSHHPRHKPAAPYATLTIPIIFSLSDLTTKRPQPPGRHPNAQAQRERQGEERGVLRDRLGGGGGGGHGLGDGG